jgi:hypothetical protein
MSEALDFNKHIMREARASDAINAAIDAGLIAKRQKQERRAYVGASAIGHECERAIQFEYAGAPKESDFGPETLRRFDSGHMGEELARAWFFDAGFKLVQRNQRNGERFRWTQLEDQFSGEPDGVFIDGPAIPDVTYPAMWEHKYVGTKTFRDIGKNGLKKARHGYWMQCQINMAYLGLTDSPTIFTVTCGDDGQQLHHLIEYDAEGAQMTSDKAVRIVTATKAEELLPRPFKDRSFYICKGCFFVERCWSLAQ